MFGRHEKRGLTQEGCDDCGEGRESWKERNKSDVMWNIMNMTNGDVKDKAEECIGDVKWRVGRVRTRR